MIAEFDLVADAADRFDRPSGVPTGIGDDAAVLESEPFDLWTTDTLVEGIHFRRDWCSDEAIGWRALVASLSDIAAMGGRPGPYLLSLGLGDGLDDAAVRDWMRGLRDAAASMTESAGDVGAAGGDTTSTPGASFLSISLLGRLDGADPLLRSGAEVGDRLFVSGPLGRSAAGLELLERGGDPDGEAEAALIEAYCRPIARTAIGARLGRESWPSALIDLSDGLAADLGHLVDASGVGARVDVDAIPRSPDLETVAASRDLEIETYLLGGGEDFELLVAVPPDDVDALRAAVDEEDWPVAEIGVIVPAEDGVAFRSQGRTLDVADLGYEHVRT